MAQMHAQSDSSDRSAPTDEQLLGRYQQGQTDAFELLVNRYRNELFHFLIRFTGDRQAAEDVFQEAFIQVHLSASTFDIERRFKPWLFTIAANKARDHLRRNSRRPTTPLSAPVGTGEDQGQSFVDLLEAAGPLPEQQAQSQELADRVQTVALDMPDHLRQILLLAYFHRLAYNEIAEALEIPLGTVKSRLHTAVATFARLWKKQNPSASST